jgi:hypothetical protein
MCNCFGREGIKEKDLMARDWRAPRCLSKHFVWNDQLVIFEDMEPAPGSQDHI